MEIRHTEAVDAQSLKYYDAILDVRSPGEFAEDHMPGAENLPVLDDAERAEVGTIYVQQSRFLARRIGAAHVARNIARHLEGALADRPASFRPLIYCWRGGQRSNAMATILSQVGWPVTLLTGGYKTYRRTVTARLYEEAQNLRLVLLDGHTGTAKTEILGRLAARGLQTLDLEGLAAHRGSLFGAIGREQPSQKMFESRLLAELDALDPARPIFVEAESSKIGERMTPPVIWKAMQAAPRVEITAPLDARARYLVTAYGDIIRNPVELDAAFARLPVYPGQKRLENWRGLAGAGAFEELASALMEHHYDPAYDRSARKDQRPRLGVIALSDLSAGSQERAADEIMGLAAGLDSAS
ncbi:tRNA 2-selenouridine(34) synthase MnmH [Phenylobacterium aquaticum]|uniref:tRNA 2-selenouridine(34) synthase MnmH n=1 Tax=Phenylobacterium aquaticum TaxID=1763816 RepID=UPI001F5E1190|nr:tRNA 2-selenouridine(34) synthase MnmH [Phenylobacterium aquaticum]MCI3133777.1 tRNA 2-selenouridine(34) synthase MnmH [Phenylobacterium aquaticum]